MYKDLDTNAVLRMAKALELVEMQTKHDPAAGGATLSMLDTGGALSNPHTYPDVISAIQQPRSWIEKLALKRSNIRNRQDTVLTGLQAMTGSNPDSTCGSPMRPGNLKTCTVNLSFGQLYIGTEKIKFDEVALRDSHGVAEKRIVNGVQAFANTPWVPDPLRQSNINAASAAATALFKLATNIKRSVAKIEAIGNNTLTGGARRDGWVSEFDGLDRLLIAINDVNGQACPAASPLIENWGAALTASVNGLTIVQLMHDIWYSKSDLAEETGIDMPRLTWLMDKRLFRQLVHQFACNYASARCGDGTQGNPINREAAELERRRNEMWNGRYLLIDGVATPVEFTSGSEVDTSSGAPFDSSIYLIPMNSEYTWMEYNPFDAELLTQALADFGGDTTKTRATNSGLYILFNRSDGICAELNATAMVRLVMRARFLSARIDGVQFNSYVGYRDWDPDGTSWYNGGTTFYNNNL